jgi:L-iditol 2-dehydrogenase
METMRAVVRDADGVRLRRVAAPRLGGERDAIVEIAYGGVCRTDLEVADGRLGAPPVILGHEVAGRVAALGAAVRDLAVGDPVVVVPWDDAGAWLGVDRDGGFAERLRVDAARLRRLPPAVPLALGAYVEPVAAALGVLRAVAPGDRVLVGGDNRIAALTRRVLEAHRQVAVVREPDGPVDVAIESAGADGLGALIAALRPGGTLVVKSRRAAPATIDLGGLVARELTVRALGHGSFAQAIDWLASGRLAVDDLLAPARPLEEIAEVLREARRSEAQKPMLRIGEAA